MPETIANIQNGFRIPRAGRQYPVDGLEGAARPLRAEESMPATGVCRIGPAHGDELFGVERDVVQRGVCGGSVGEIRKPGTGLCRPKVGKDMGRVCGRAGRFC